MFTTTPPAKLLIADDNEEFRDALIQLLGRHGFECTGVSSADAALALLQADAFDALISDIQMPGNSSLEFIKTISGTAPGLPVILLTGQPSVETAIRAVGLPVVAYLTKPPQITELVTLLETSTAGYRCLRCLDESRGRLRDWDAKLESLSSSLRNSKLVATRPSAGDYLRNGLQFVLYELAAMEQSVAIWNRNNDHKPHLRNLDLIGAIQHTIEVLEQTKQNFKSAKLGDLRQRLEALIASR